MSGTTDPQGKSASEIEGEVEATRARVTETLDALRDRMSPGQIVDQFVDYARDSGGTDFARNLGSSVRDNPLPVALIGAGIAWLMLTGDKKNSGGRDAVLALPPPALPPTRTSAAPGFVSAGTEGPDTLRTAHVRVSGMAEGTRDHLRAGAEAIGDTAARARGTASRAVDAIMGVASDAAEAVSETASGVAGAASRMVGGASDAASDAASGAARLYDQTATGTSRAAGAGTERAGALAASASRGWSRMAEEQPLLMGALGLALGAALGAILPRTRTEDELMGEASDAVTERAGSMAHQGMERAAEVAGQQFGQVQVAVADSYSMSKDKLNEGVSAQTVGDALGTVAGRLAEAAKEAVRDVTDEARKGLSGEEAREGGTPDQGARPTSAPVPPASASVPPPTAFPSARPSSGSGSSTRSGPL